MKHLICILTGCLTAQAIAAPQNARAPGRDPLRPNILIIFTDDQRYADLASYGNELHKTPRMDQLAAEGTRFTSFYAQTVCGPSRSALLTGRYPIRSKGWGMPASEISFAERNNRAPEFPEKVAELKALMRSIESGDRLEPAANRR